jgi:hypothetical protein
LRSEKTCGVGRISCCRRIPITAFDTYLQSFLTGTYDAQTRWYTQSFLRCSYDNIYSPGIEADFLGGYGTNSVEDDLKDIRIVFTQ